jgi:hypothetical protein
MQYNIVTYKSSLLHLGFVSRNQVSGGNVRHKKENWTTSKMLLDTFTENEW